MKTLRLSILLSGILFFVSASRLGAQVTYTLGTTSYYDKFTDGGDIYENASGPVGNVGQFRQQQKSGGMARPQNGR